MKLIWAFPACRRQVNTLSTLSFVSNSSTALRMTKKDAASIVNAIKTYLIKLPLKSTPILNGDK